jgi:hypothetical protein
MTATSLHPLHSRQQLWTVKSQNWSQSCVRLTSDVTTDRQSASLVLVSSTHLYPKIGFLLLSDSFCFVHMWCSLWWENWSVVCNCFWSSPAQWFSGPRPVRLMTIFSLFQIPDSFNSEARSHCLYSSGTGWHSYTPKTTVKSKSKLYYDRGQWASLS